MLNLSQSSFIPLTGWLAGCAPLLLLLLLLLYHTTGSLLGGLEQLLRAARVNHVRRRTTFSLADAQTVANYVKANGIGRISYWSFQRDRAQADSSATDINAFSGVAQSDFQFHKIFKSASGSVPVTTATAAATPLATAACGSSSWILGNQYAAGSVVSYTDGQLYVAKYANPGYVPTVSTYYWAPYSCAAAPA